MIKLTAEQVYERLMDVDKILSVQGQIRFYLGNVNIIVRQKDVVGNIIQEWLEGWLRVNEIAFTPNPNPQMPPDFFLDPDNEKKDLLEVKAFNFDAAPGFDIADFRAFQSEIISQPYMLHVKYLVFGYKMNEDGYVSISNLWLKNVWELTRPMNNWALNLQVKKGIVHKIRPATFYTPPRQFATFECLEDFLGAMEECVYQNPATHNFAGTWKSRMIDAYFRHYGKMLDIPRWGEIKSKYVLR